MAKQHESKAETKVESKPDAEDAPVTKAEASEILSTEFNAAISLERIADALERLADRYAPIAPVHGIATARGLPQCAKGHAMQPTDNYCQACERERRNPPKPAPSNDAA